MYLVKTKAKPNKELKDLKVGRDDLALDSDLLTDIIGRLDKKTKLKIEPTEASLTYANSVTANTQEMPLISTYRESNWRAKTRI